MRLRSQVSSQAVIAPGEPLSEHLAQEAEASLRAGGSAGVQRRREHHEPDTLEGSPSPRHVDEVSDKKDMSNAAQAKSLSEEECFFAGGARSGLGHHCRRRQTKPLRALGTPNTLAAR